MDLPGYIAIEFPQMLLIGGVLVWLYTRRLRRRNLWRTLLLVLAVLLACYPSIVRTTKAFDLYVLADRSRSISEEGRAKQTELLEMINRQLRPGDRVALVSFNERAHIEQIAESQTTVKSFSIPYSEDASDLTEGLSLALSQVDGKRPSRLLLLSDGEYTGRDPRPEALSARQRGIPIFYRNLKRVELFNLSVRDAVTPDQIMAGEPCRIAFTVNASEATEGRYRVWRDGTAVGSGTNEEWRAFNFQAGANTIAFTDTLGDAGIHSYKLEVEAMPAGREKLLTDNFGERFVKVVGERSLLIVNNTGAADNVSGILTAGGIKCHAVAIGNFHMGVEQLSGYKGVILNNVPVIGLTVTQLEALRNFVEQEGGGLMVCGGNRSFAAGGYYKTALEPILPVALEDRQQSKKVSTAFSIAMDRSGSMSMSTPSGQTKIALANTAVVESIGLMSPVDSLSVIAVDSLAHVMVPQQPVDDPQKIISNVRRIDSQGGGIFVYTALAAAGKELMGAPQLNKHILLFADAADSEEPGDYKKLVEEYVQAGITISVVGLGTEKDQDAEFLKDIAKRANGSIYFTQDAAQLMQFFTADTITYTRNSYVEEAAPMAVKAAARAISPEQEWHNFSGAGYNLLFPKPKADIAIQTSDDDQAPVLAFWQRGLGRVTALALNAEGPFSGDPQFGDVMLSAARWMMGSSVDDNLQIRVAYDGGMARVQIEVSDEERERMGAAGVQIFSPKGETLSRPLTWDAHNRLSAWVKLGEAGCWRGSVQIGDRTFRLPPMSVSVSPEFSHDREPDFGRKTLTQLASLTGGSEILDVRDLFERKTSAHVVTPLLFPLLVAFLILLLLEIAEPRFALLPWAHAKLARSGAWLRVKLTRSAKPSIPAKAPMARADEESDSSRMPSGAPVTVAAAPEVAGEPRPVEKPVEKPEKKAPPADTMDYLARSKAQSSRTIRVRTQGETKKRE
ncbi:MAG TPA: VWA domain-containing protein [Candidatus Sumerlaeota bacterium]|nr:VWA domain-containing protein [Candidatus Sumerlaeota bacterium]